MANPLIYISQGPLPKYEEEVLLIVNGCYRIGARRREHGTWEDSYAAYDYWDDLQNEGQGWDWPDVTAWMKLPPIVKEENKNG